VNPEEARDELGWRWPVQQALWDLIRQCEITTWTDAVALTVEVDRVLRDHGFEVVPAIDARETL
jgi:hypothetical protein